MKKTFVFIALITAWALMASGLFSCTKEQPIDNPQDLQKKALRTAQTGEMSYAFDAYNSCDSELIYFKGTIPATISSTETIITYSFDFRGICGRGERRDIYFGSNTVHGTAQYSPIYGSTPFMVGENTELLTFRTMKGRIITLRVVILFIEVNGRISPEFHAIVSGCN